MSLQSAVVIKKSGGVEQLKLIQKEIPTPGPNQVLIKIDAAGVAFADVLMREGVYPDVPKKDLTPGYDLVGYIKEVGSNVKSLTVGQRVVALSQTGGYANYIAIEHWLVAPCPKDIPSSIAVALILNYVSAYQMIHRIARVSEGASMLVHGPSGGVGAALVQLGNLLGCKIYGTISNRKMNQLEKIDFIPLQYQNKAFEQTLQELAPNGVDYAFDAIGGSHLKRSYQALSSGGAVVSYGMSCSIENGRRNLFQAVKGILSGIFFPLTMMADSKTVHGYSIWKLVNTRPDWFQEDIASVFELFQQGKINPAVAKVLSLSDAKEAHRLIQTAEVIGKLVLTPQD